jgi:flavin-dependent dehydrogenase
MPGTAASPLVAPLDALIIGGGPAGCATALALHRAGVHKVWLVDAGWRWPGLRVESATPDVPALLARLGVSLPAGSGPCEGTASSWGREWRVDAFASRGLGPGAMVDRHLLDAHLQAAVQDAGVPFHTAWALAHAERQGVLWHVDLRGVGRGAQLEQVLHVKARCLIDASGRRAALAARTLGVRRRTLDHQVALQMRIPSHEAWPQARRRLVMVEACAHGWWCLVPSSTGQASLSLMTDTDLAPALRTAQAFDSALQSSMLWQQWWMPTSASSQASVPEHTQAAHSACLAQAAGPGWLAVGDALMSLDPLSSSGISGALRDGIEAVDDVLLPWLGGAAPAPAGRAWGERANRAWCRFMTERQALHDQAWEERWASSVYWRRRMASRALA